MSIDYDLFVIDANNKDTTPEQLRDCIKDALESIDQRLTKQEKLMEVMVSHLDTQSKINHKPVTGNRLEGFDRDKFANDFEEEHGWCPDAGYEEIKRTGECQSPCLDYTKKLIKEAFEKAKNEAINN